MTPWRVPLIAMALLTAAGCGAPLLSREDLDSVRAGQRSLVLLRLQGQVGNEAIVPELSWIEDGGICGQIIRLDAPQQVSQGQAMACLDQASGRLGWVALVLAPGTHLLRLSGGQGGRLRSDRFFADRSAMSLLLDVPRGGTAIYAGTVHWQGERLKLLFERRYRWKSPTLCSDGSVDAGELPIALLLPTGPLRTQAARIYGEPTPGALAAARAVDLEVAGHGALGSPDWTVRGISLFTGIGQTGAGSAQLGEGLSGTGEAGAAILVGYLLYLPVGATVGAVAGAVHGAELKPAMEALARQVQEYDAVAHLRATLAQQLASSATAPGCDRLRLRVELLRVQLREVDGSHNPFCLEVATRATLVDPIQGTTPFDAYLTYSNRLATVAGTGPPPLPTEILLEPESPPHPIAEWGGPSGGRLLDQQLNQAIDTIGCEVIRHAGLSDHAGTTGQGGDRPMKPVP